MTITFTIKNFNVYFGCIHRETKEFKKSGKKGHDSVNERKRIHAKKKLS